MESLHKKTQLMLEFLKVAFLVLHFCYLVLHLLDDAICDIMLSIAISLMMLSMVMILLSILSVIAHVICGNNLNWVLNLNLIYETLWTGVRSGLLILMLGKLNWFPLTDLITMVLLM